MQPSVWGPHIWYTIHYVALAYPTLPTSEDKAAMKMFLLSLGEVLPCKTCRVHFKEHLEKMPLDDHALSSKNTLFEWTVKLHNEVNETTGKNTVWTVEQALEYYKGYTGNPTFHLPTCKTTNAVFVCLALLTTVIIAIYLSHRRKVWYGKLKKHKVIEQAKHSFWLQSPLEMMLVLMWTCPRWRPRLFLGVWTLFERSPGIWGHGRSHPLDR